MLPEPTLKVTATHQPAVRSSAGSLVWDRARRAYHLKWTGTFAKADIWFDNALPGVTGGPIRYEVVAHERILSLAQGSTRIARRILRRGWVQVHPGEPRIPRC